MKSYSIYTTSDFPYGTCAENFVRQLALGLKHHGKKVNVVLLKGNFHNNPKENDTEISYRYIFLKKRVKSEILKFLELLATIFLIPFSIIKDKFINKTNILILYGVEYFYLVFPSWLACKLLGIKIFNIVTDFYKDSTIAPVSWKKIKIYFRDLQFKYFDKYLNGLVFLSIYLVNKSVSSGIPRTKICLIPHLIDIEHFNVPNLIMNSNSKIRIGFSGTPLKSSGIFVLGKAFTLLKEKYHNIELLIVGGFLEDDKKIFDEIINEYNSDVHFTGKVTYDKIPGLLQTCHILINPILSGPSADAGFPTKLAEYLSTGRPVVSNSTMNIKHFFENNNQLVLTDSDTPESLYEGIRYLLDNREQAEMIGQRGKKWAEENLNYKNSCAKLIEFFEK